MIGRWALGKLLGRWSAIKVAYKKSVVVGLEEVGRGVEGCRTQQQQHMCTWQMCVTQSHHPAELWIPFSSVPPLASDRRGHLPRQPR